MIASNPCRVLLHRFPTRSLIFCSLVTACDGAGSASSDTAPVETPRHAGSRVLQSAPAGATHETLQRGRRIEGIWINDSELQALRAQGSAWRTLVKRATDAYPPPDLSDQNTRTNVVVLAKALVYARTKQPELRDAVLAALRRVVGTERGGTTLPLGRKLISYVIAAELVALPPNDETAFRAWLTRVLDTKLRGRTLRSTHEDRPNNWGTHAGASRAAVARYLGREIELERCAQVFRGWLGGRAYYDGFKFGADLSWQADADRPVAVNPTGASKDGHSIDGVLPDDQRRGGAFRWPPPHENYVYEALQGALAQAVILDRAGYEDVWEWEDRALLRAFRWLNDVAGFPAEGDDTWQLPLVDHYYGTRYWNGNATRPGKSLGWTDWTHPPAPTDSRPAGESRHP